MRKDPILVPKAVAVESQIEKVLIPAGLQTGDCFIYTPKNGRTFTVIVPPNSRPGTFLNIVVPDEAVAGVDNGNSSNHIKISKSTAGAILFGGVIGAVVLGPIGAVIFAGGAAYATTRQQGRVGRAARKVGDTTYNSIAKAKNWAVSKMKPNNSTPTEAFFVETPIVGDVDSSPQSTYSDSGHVVL